MSSKKGVKLSLGEFIGAAGGSAATSSLPKGPAQRAPDDDGAFKRPVRRSDNYNDQPPTRSEGDGNWRRGGGSSGGAPSSGFGGSNTGSDNYRDQEPSRSEGDGNWRRGGADHSSGGGNRDSYVNNRSGGRSNDDRGAGGYSRDTGSDNRSGNNWRGGGINRENVNPTPSASSGERPRLQLKSRTAPIPEPISVKEHGAPPITNAPTQKTKPNPFGSAVAVDVALNSTESNNPNVSADQKEVDKGVLSNDKTVNELAETVEATVSISEVTVETKEVLAETKVDEETSEIKPSDATVSIKEVTEEIKVEEKTSEIKSSDMKSEKRDKGRREPDVINSRAAAFGGGNNTAVNKSEVNNDRREKQGPPPVLNPRFEKLADEERERKNDRETTNRRDRIPENEEGPPPVLNSRFAAVVEADRSYTKPDDRGPPPVVNSRFSAAADADRSYIRPDDRGPPPIVNSRFAALTETDRPPMDRDFDGPPPMANSRFAAAAEADGRPNFARDDRGPPPVANSRFAAAAARAEDERMEYEDRRRERESFYNRDDQSRGAIPQNSRFAAAAAADSDYIDRESREQSGARFGDRGDDNYRRNDHSRGSRPPARREPEFDEPLPPPQTTRVDELLKPKKLDDLHVVPPTKEHEANILKVPEKAFKREEETFLAAPLKKVEKPPVPIEETTPKVQVISAESIESLLTEFSSGEKLGDELKQWCEGSKPLPPIEKLLFHMLQSREKLNPDPNCEWADASKYGTALLHLIEENLYNQMQILWAIQMYCDTLGFPKVNGESVVQSMFRAMYKYDLAEADAFIEWKEDESDAHEKGKMTTIIQTVDWFNWLEADDDDDEEEGDDDEDGME